MKTKQQALKPQDLVVLLKIVSSQSENWTQTSIANELHMSQSEISESMGRSKYAGLLDIQGKKVKRLAFMELLQYGVSYVFPQMPGAIVRGFATAHSAAPLNKFFKSEEHYVWPSGKGNVRGQSVVPLYASVVEAVQKDAALYELLALVDAIRVGKSREKEMAIKELKKRILDGE